MFKDFLNFAKSTANTIKGIVISQLAQAASGGDEFGTIIFTGAVVDGDNFTIDSGSWTGRAHYESNTDVTSQAARKYFLKLVANTASLTLGDATLNNTTAGVIRSVTITGHSMSLGHVFGVGTEFFRVVNIRDANTVDVFRGYGGSTVAAHVATAAVLVTANYTGINLGTDIVIPVTALAIATAGGQIATAMAAVDGLNPKDFSNISAGIYKQPSLGFGFVWEYISGTTRLFFHRAARAAATSSTTLAMTYAITNATGSAALVQATQVGEVKSTVESRVPTAAEVTAGYMDFAFSYPIKTVQTIVTTTATGAVIAWNGATAFSADFKRVTVDNSSTTDWATTNTVTLKVTG